MCRVFRIFSVLASILLLLSCATGKDVQYELEKSFSEVQSSRPWFTGFMLYEPASKKVVFEHHSHKYFTPASTVKLFTFYTGIKLLKDSVPGLKYSINNDTLYFKGTGDPTFLHKDFNSSKILNFLGSRPETLTLVSPEPSEKPFGPGWAWDDYNYGFSSERSAFPIYGNVVAFNFSPEEPLQVDPPYFKDLFQGDSEISRTQREYLKNSFRFPLFGTSAFQQKIPFITSPELTAILLQDTLNRQVNFRNDLPKDFVFQNKLYSQPLDSLYKKMLQDSDNLLAEQLLLVASGEISDTLTAKIAIDHVKENLLQDLPDEVKWVDGSGLSRYNLITPRSVVKLLEKLYEEVPQERLFALFPAGGISGTLKNDYKAPPGKAPFIYAKTGTLSNNHSLSGYLITASGKLLIFSFMNSNYVVPTDVVKAEMARILRNIYLNY